MFSVMSVRYASMSSSLEGVGDGEVIVCEWNKRVSSSYEGLKGNTNLLLHRFSPCIKPLRT